MSSIEEKRVFGDRRGATVAVVATAAGVVRVRVADGHVGEFGLVHRCDARDVAAPPRGGSGDPSDSGTGPDLAVATAEDVLVGRVATGGPRDVAGGSSGVADQFTPTGFGPAVAVGFDAGTPLAAAPDGRVARRSGDDWVTAGTAVGVRALDGDLVAADTGVYRVTAEGLRHVGLDHVRDVSVAGTPLAATEAGLYWLGNGWMDALSGPFALATSDPRTAVPGALGRAHAATDDTLYAHGDGSWRAVALPVDESVVGVGYGSGVYVVTADGAFLAASDDAGRGADWRTSSLGLDSRAVAVPPGGKGV